VIKSEGTDRHFFWLAEEDVAAARRVLLLLADDSGRRRTSNNAPDRQTIFERAQLLLAMRQRRIEVFGPRFSTEPPFAMLLALFVIEDREPQITVTRLGELSRIGITTTLRWLAMLVDNGWVQRTDVEGDRRKAQISLTEKSRDAMERLFSWPG
jgi:predicted transcriptional regulator